MRIRLLRHCSPYAIDYGLFADSKCDAGQIAYRSQYDSWFEQGPNHATAESCSTFWDLGRSISVFPCASFEPLCHGLLRPSAPGRPLTEVSLALSNSELYQARRVLDCKTFGHRDGNSRFAGWPLLVTQTQCPFAKQLLCFKVFIRGEMSFDHSCSLFSSRVGANYHIC